jgi:competence protein ComEA
VVLVVAAAGVWFGGRPRAPVPVEVDRGNSDGLANSPGPAVTFTVDVTGRVAAPGLVTVTDGARVADAIMAAGGALSGADLSSLNLATRLSDGMQVVVPEHGAVAPEQSTTSGKVAINSAGPEELATLPGIGPVLAERIAMYREEHGPFATVEDLLDVPGIGEAKLASLRDAVLVP